MTRDEIQQEAHRLCDLYEDNLTLGLGMGAGKSRIAIERIKRGKYRNVLILGYRTSLKSNWSKQLIEWAEYAPGHRTEAIDDCRFWIKTDTEDARIQIHNIQTSYKWDKEYVVDFNKFDFIIADESHELFTPEYGKFFINARKYNIPILALSGTPDYKNKKDFYDKYCPIRMEYYDVEGEITNKVKLYAYFYELTDNYKVKVETKARSWWVGEAKQYQYLSEKYEEAKNKMFELGASDYFETSMLWMKGKQKVFETVVVEGVTSIIETEIDATKEQKEWGRKFFNAISYRKNFLWGLSSSVAHSNNIKHKILSNPNNKVLLFTKSIPQTYRLSQNVVHSKVAKTAKECELINKQTLDKFNDGLIRDIASVNSLTSGVNLKGLNWIVVDAMDSSDVKGQQIRGRGRRLGLDLEANMVIVVPKNTQMLRWFNEAYGDMEYEILENINDLKV